MSRILARVCTAGREISHPKQVYRWMRVAATGGPGFRKVRPGANTPSSAGIRHGFCPCDAVQSRGCRIPSRKRLSAGPGSRYFATSRRRAVTRGESVRRSFSKIREITPGRTNRSAPGVISRTAKCQVIGRKRRAE